MTLYTIGHSTHTLDEFASLLTSRDVTRLVDIRTVPRSRHTPQFNEGTAAEEFAARGIHYRHLAELGGLRHTTKASINTGWRNASFRGYADYMQTDGFADGIDLLVAEMSEGTTAIMCAEAVPWRCHRSMVGDAMIVRGVDVYDIFPNGTARQEKLTGFARVQGTAITYPAPDADTDPQR